MNCNRISQTGRGETDGYGRFGNLCQVDCSDQGICDYTTGTCTCFKGYWGENCNTTIRGPTGARRVP